MSAFGKPPACATARLSDRPAVGIASNSVQYLTAIARTLMHVHRKQANLARSKPLGRNLQSLPQTGETARLRTFLVKRASRARRCKLPQLCFLPELPILTQTPQVANGQGGIDQRLINSTDETIDSKANIVAICAGD
jgi:hypothetical protein